MRHHQEVLSLLRETEDNKKQAFQKLARDSLAYAGSRALRADNIQLLRSLTRMLDWIAAEADKFPPSFPVDRLLTRLSLPNTLSPVVQRRICGILDCRKRGDFRALQHFAYRGGRASVDPNPAEYRAPPPTHPIYGRNGIMCGILARKLPTGGLSYRLDPAMEACKADNYGHNKMEVGAWFATQLAAVRWGAHGAPQAGIYGREEDGAFSIVMSGKFTKYFGLDEDNGDDIWYACSSAGTHNHYTPPANLHTRALLTSSERKNPIRVLRRAHPGGLRYDGLYVIVSHELAVNNLNGRYQRFRLIRMPGQPPLDDIRQKRPTYEEKVQWKKLRDGY